MGFYTTRILCLNPCRNPARRALFIPNVKKKKTENQEASDWCWVTDKRPTCKAGSGIAFAAEFKQSPEKAELFAFQLATRPLYPDAAQRQTSCVRSSFKGTAGTKVRPPPGSGRLPSRSAPATSAPPPPPRSSRAPDTGRATLSPGSAGPGLAQPLSHPASRERPRRAGRGLAAGGRAVGASEVRAGRGEVPGTSGRRKQRRGPARTASEGRPARDPRAWGRERGALPAGRAEEGAPGRARPGPAHLHTCFAAAELPTARAPVLNRLPGPASL